MQSRYLRGNQTETVGNHRDKRRRVCPVLSQLLFCVSSFAGVQRTSPNTNACTAAEKRNVCGIVLVPTIAAGRLRGVLRLSFDVKHVRHGEYVNNANKTLFIARAAPSLFYHCFLHNLFIPFIPHFFTC